MDESRKIQIVKNMIGNDDDDTVISTYLEFAGQEIIRKAYPYENNITTVPPKYEHLQIEIAVFLLNKRGAEGQITHSENGIQRQYETGGIPKSLLSSITPHCGTF